MFEGIGWKRNNENKWVGVEHGNSSIQMTDAKDQVREVMQTGSTIVGKIHHLHVRESCQSDSSVNRNVTNLIYI